MPEWTHMYKHIVARDRKQVIQFLQDIPALLASAEGVTSVKQVDLEESDGDAQECWLVIEEVKTLRMEATTRVKVKKTPDGIDIHRRNAHGIELWSVWTVKEHPKQDEHRQPMTIATEFIMAKAPWYAMPIIKGKILQTHSKNTLQRNVEKYMGGRRPSSSVSISSMT